MFGAPEHAEQFSHVQQEANDVMICQLLFIKWLPDGARFRDHVRRDPRRQRGGDAVFGTVRHMTLFNAEKSTSRIASRRKGIFREIFPLAERDDPPFGRVGRFHRLHAQVAQFDQKNSHR